MGTVLEVERHKNLLNQHRTREITTEELNEQCAYWLYETLDTLKPKTPPDKPISYADFVKLWQSDQPDSKKQAISDAYLARHTKIRPYMKLKAEIGVYNYSKYKQLLYFNRFIPIADRMVKTAYAGKIREFQLSYRADYV